MESMIEVKGFLLVTIFLVSQICHAQILDEAMLYRKDFKEISAKNTVTVTSYEKDGAHYVYAGGFGDIDVYTLSIEGKLELVSSHGLYKEKGPARGMVADNIGGTDFLFVANKFGDVVETFEILENGSIDRVSLTEDTEETYLGTAITLQIVHMEKSSYLFVGGLEEIPGLSCFRIQSDGSLTHIQSLKDDENMYTDGVIGMFVHKIDDQTFLYTGGFHDSGISSFKVYEDGRFENLNNIGDNDTDRYLTGAYPVTGVTLGENRYVIVGHRHHKYYARGNFIKQKDFIYHGDAVSVFKVGVDGALQSHSTLIDDESTKLGGQTRIEIVSSGEDEAILAVGTRDDESIQLCKLNKEGILTPINYLETGYSIYYGLRSHQIEESNFLIAGSFRFDLQKLVSYKISPKIDRSQQMLRHVVNLKYSEEASAEQVHEAEIGFENLRHEIPQIVNLEWGVNDSTEEHSKGFTHCFTLTFNDEHARETYLFHKAHLDLLTKVGPIVDDVMVMDYWTER